MRSLIVLCGLLAATSAGAQTFDSCGGTGGFVKWAKTGTYQGTIGGTPITLQINLSETGQDAAYFYNGKGVDINLQAFKSGNQLILQETAYKQNVSAPVVTGCFTLTANGTRLVGTWNKSKSTSTQKVALNVVNSSKVPLALLASPDLIKMRKEDPYNFFKMNHSWITTRNTLLIKEPYSGLSYPRIDRASAGLNMAFQDRQMANALYSLDCISMLPEPVSKDDGYELTTTITLNSTHLVSLEEANSYYCGGAHPDHSLTGFIWDKKSGQAVKLDAIWPKLTLDKQKELYLKHILTDVDPECLPEYKTMPPEFTSSLSLKGLNLTPTSFPHAMAACAKSVEIPYGEIRAEASTQSLYFKDLYSK